MSNDANKPWFRRPIISLICAVVVATASCGVRAGMLETTEVIDLTKAKFPGLPPSFKATLYRDAASSEKQALVVLVPQFGARVRDSPYRQQAEFFVKAGYIAAVPHLTGLYNDGIEVPVYDARMDADFAADTTPFAIEVLALVATLSQPGGPASSKHVIVGEGFGSIIAARYAALAVPGCKGLIMVSAGFGAKRSSLSQMDDMRASEEAFRRLAGKVTVPSLWIYARGNKRISESSANELVALFKTGSPMAQLLVLPDIGMNGDLLFSKAEPQSTWGEPASRFLGSLDLH